MILPGEANTKKDDVIPNPAEGSVRNLLFRRRRTCRVHALSMPLLQDKSMRFISILLRRQDKQGAPLLASFARSGIFDFEQAPRKYRRAPSLAAFFAARVGSHCRQSHSDFPSRDPVSARPR
jgi:hypothetical protein